MTKARIHIMNGEDAEGGPGCLIRFNPNRYDQKISISGWAWDDRTSDFEQFPIKMGSVPKSAGSDTVINHSLDVIKAKKDVGHERKLDEVDIDNHGSGKNIYCELKANKQSFRIDGYHANPKRTALMDQNKKIENFCVISAIKS